MADRSHLTPFTITDKLGRTTTVYRNLAPRKKPPAPAISAPSSRTPLPAITVRSRKARKQFERTVEGLCADQHLPYRADPERWERTREAALAASIAMDLIDSGELPEQTVAMLLRSAAGGMADDGRYWNVACDMLRIAAYLYPRIEEDRRFRIGEARQFLWAIPNAVFGLHRGNPTGPRLIATREELASYSAVVEFIARNPLDSTLTCGGKAGGHRGIEITRVRNPHLEKLLRERPEESDRIFAYVSERGIGPTSRGDVETLKAWLDAEGAKVLADGWL